MSVLPTDAEVDRVRRMVISFLRLYRQNVDYEDLVQEATLLSWQQWPRLRDRYALSTVVGVCCRSATSSWFRSRRCRYQERPTGSRRWSKTQKNPTERRPAPVILFLDEILPVREIDNAAAQEKLIDAALVVADFSTRLLADLDYRAQSEKALAAMTPMQAAFVKATVMAGEPVTGMAGVMGRSRKTVWVAVKRGLERGRLALAEASLCD